MFARSSSSVQIVHPRIIIELLSDGLRQSVRLRKLLLNRQIDLEIIFNALQQDRDIDLTVRYTGSSRSMNDNFRDLRIENALQFQKSAHPRKKGEVTETSPS